MNFDDISRIWDRFDKSEVSECCIEIGGDSITLRRESAAPVIMPPPPAGMPYAPFDQAHIPGMPGVEAAGDASEDENDILIKAPLVGTYYEAKAPGEEPFVKVGQRVEKGDQVAILEAMKLMNVVEAPESGIIKSIEVSDGESVEYGQVMIRMDRL